MTRVRGSAERVGYYAASLVDPPQFSPLHGRHEAAVVVIGGGFAGLNTALSLVERGVTDVVLLEAAQVGFGASGRNGGFVFAGYSLGEQALLDQLGQVQARSLFQRSVDALDTIRRRIAEYAIHCDMVDHGVIWANWFDDPDVLRRRQQLLAEHFDVRWQWLSRDQMRQRLVSSRYGDGLFERNAMHINPLKYAVGLAAAAASQGVRVHEHSSVCDIRRDGAGWRVRGEHGEVTAADVVLACGGYLAGLQRKVDRAVLPIATYAMVTEPLGERLGTALRTRAAVYDTRFAFDYYRPLPDTRLLWGGRISILDRSAVAVARLLKADLTRVFPQLADVGVDYAWSGLMSYARHQMPQIGGNEEGLWWAQAFGGHGLAPTTVAGDVLAAAIGGDDQGLQAFSPFGLVDSFRPLGLLAAQASYSWLQMKDRLRGG